MLVRTHSSTCPCTHPPTQLCRTWEAVGSSGSCYLKSGSWTEAATRRNSMVSGNWAPQGMPAVLATENIVSFAHCSAGQVITGISNPFFGAGTTNASTSFA